MATDPAPSAGATPAGPPSPADLQAEIAAAREELVANLSALRGEAAPGALVRRTGRAVTGWFTDEFGGIRPERVAIAAGVVVGFIALSALRRRR